MKTLTKIAALALIVSMSSVATAGWTDSAPAKSFFSAWSKVTTEVKVTVTRIVNYFAPTQTAPQKVVEKAPVENQKPQASGVTARTANVTASAPSPAPKAATPVPAIPRTVAAQSPGLQKLGQVKDKLKSTQVLTVAKPARAGTSKLSQSKEGVPQVNWSQLRATKKITKLDIGTEALISKEDFQLDGLQVGVQPVEDMKRLPSPAALDPKVSAELAQIKPAKVTSEKTLMANIRTVGQPLDRSVVDKVHYQILAASESALKAYKPLTEEQMKMLAALILFEQGNHCHMIMGLFHQLATQDKVQSPQTKIEAQYHLGSCAAQLKMYQSAFDQLKSVVASKDPDFAVPALKAMVTDLPAIYERDFYALVKEQKNFKAMLAEVKQPETLDLIAYKLAKGAYRSRDYKTALTYAEQVRTQAEFSDDARFLSSMNSFALGDKTAALKKLQDLWASIESRKVSGNIRALTSLNLARMHFATKNYSKALENYAMVPKDHPLWVQALIEQGWTQLALEDYSGAIGNMYSLHSPYFKAVYQPESFVVRTIGYLNICQYGDAYRSLSFLEKDYRDWHDKTSKYLAQKQNPLDIYRSVSTYIRGKSTDEVEGVPYQVWRDMARRKEFLNLQLALNDKSDETTRYEGVNEKIKTEKAGIRWRADQAKKRFDQNRALLAKAKVDKTMAKNVDQWMMSLKLERDLTIGYRFQLAMLEQSRQGYLDYQKTSQSKLDKETAALTVQAGQTLLNAANHMNREMKRVLENNEFLRYEVFSGSGENIRYQVAGGEVEGKNRVPAHIKPTKMMNWNFDGEFWEDEIGSYRSSLQNSCPMNAGNQIQDKVPTEQARHLDEEE